MFDLTGRVALVTGAASGIGAEVAGALAAQGAVVAGADLRTDALGGCASAHRVDVADPDSARAGVAEVLDRHGRLDVLVNSAGIALLAPALELGVDEWRRTLDVNLTGSWLMAQAAGRVMVEQGYGRIVNLASQAASSGLEKHAAYCASKAGINGLTRTLAVEWGPQGVTVNAVSPTVVLTALGREVWDNPAGDAHRAEIPARRFAEPSEIAAAVVYLASTEAAMVNGAELRVDGGFTAR
ncbi:MULTISPECIES: GolD/DthD family dehydrogenase [Pseudonocardia]|uniref:3-oxoacyl-[acyl-carrier-protein] reductase FabG n=2 Tax=Pseudonocardia TaxID=1847 RepID=A0A1Y2MW67_PSEAH|nr:MULTISPECIES: D-threitol dehydrogenase [Pseudonocardia]OSY39426.1 3-oxoacyl-[acyl-carrier-protein] reductase FabG [Pseudonocardia autotrophica]TDN75336.1 NADP-dependent 3-hydroxy acid dehydrogenase YdfG [Pseudonocardia autotrophica]BBF99282.1 D-threitol dehydrogenase [Pseudonocardia autotrophica]GEC24828.1 D-threitol dehydrogenase [Pseudonocardia saturnea]